MEKEKLEAISNALVVLFGGIGLAQNDIRGWRPSSTHQPEYVRRTNGEDTVYIYPSSPVQRDKIIAGLGAIGAAPEVFAFSVQPMVAAREGIVIREALFEAVIARAGRIMADPECNIVQTPEQTPAQAAIALLKGWDGRTR